MTHHLEPNGHYYFEQSLCQWQFLSQINFAVGKPTLCFVENFRRAPRCPNIFRRKIRENPIFDKNLWHVFSISYFLRWFPSFEGSAHETEKSLTVA